MATSPESIDDLLPGLQEPLWEGTDEAFTAYVRDAFGIPHTITTIMITPRGRAGRSAVAIGGQGGGIIFALAPSGRQTTLITPIVAGDRFCMTTPMWWPVQPARRGSREHARRDSGGGSPFTKGRRPRSVDSDVSLKIGKRR